MVLLRLEEEKPITLGTAEITAQRPRAVQLCVERRKDEQRGKIISGIPNYDRSSPLNPQDDSHAYISACQITSSDLNKIILKVSAQSVREGKSLLLNETAVLSKPRLLL